MVSWVESFSSASCDPGLAAQAGGVDQAHALALPVPVDRDGVAGDAGLGPGQQAVLADQPVDQGRLAGVGPADDGDADGLVAALGLVVVGRSSSGAAAMTAS